MQNKKFNYKTHWTLQSAIISIFFFTLASVTQDAYAFNVEITAEFTPDPSNPTVDKFKNTTPVSGYCQSLPLECQALNTFSILLPFELQNSRTIMANHSDPRQGATIKIPSAERRVDIVSDSGVTAEVKFRINGFGATQFFTPGVSIITGGLTHRNLWSTGGWVYAPAPCEYGGIGNGGDTSYAFFWKFPAVNACSTTALFDIPNIKFFDINVSYEMVATNPLSLPNGVYRGQVSFGVGPGQDFDFGDVLDASDSIVNFNFTLTVNHIFNLQFPPGSDRLALVPEGGWQQWLQRGRRPEKLFANQSFQIWSSTTFKMLLQCQYPVGDQCGIQNGAGDLVPVETRVTLPTGVVALTGMPVNRHLLSNSNASFFLPTEYVDNGRATLHFEVSRDSVVQMTNHAGSRYSGNVTIVFDSEI